MEPALAEDPTGCDITTSHPVASLHGGGGSLVRSSEAWSSFRETQLGTSGAAAIRLADVLSQDASFSDADNGAALFPYRGDELFAARRRQQ